MFFSDTQTRHVLYKIRIPDMFAQNMPPKILMQQKSHLPAFPGWLGFQVDALAAEIRQLKVIGNWRVVTNKNA